jgi:hypothetical protein
MPTDPREQKPRARSNKEASPQQKESQPAQTHQEAPQAVPSSVLQLKRSDEFESLYANNVRFESSLWDLKLIFGQLDQSTGSEVVELHTAITLPWAAAKIGLYYLRLHVALYEMENGKIWINPRIYPSEPPPLPLEAEGNELIRKARELSIGMREEFIAAQPVSPFPKLERCINECCYKINGAPVQQDEYEAAKERIISVAGGVEPGRRGMVIETIIACEKNRRAET